MQERIAFIQVKTGCTGDECAYKGNVIEKRYDLPMTSDAWREFRLYRFSEYKTWNAPCHKQKFHHPIH